MAHTSFDFALIHHVDFVFWKYIYLKARYLKYSYIFIVDLIASVLFQRFQSCVNVVEVTQYMIADGNFVQFAHS